MGRVMRIHRIPKAVSDVKVTSHDKNIRDISSSILEILKSWLWRVWIDINQKGNIVVNVKGDNRNILMKKNIFIKRKTKGRKSDIYVSNNPWAIMDVWWLVGKHKPVGVVRNSN